MKNQDKHIIIYYTSECFHPFLEKIGHKYSSQLIHIDSKAQASDAMREQMKNDILQNHGQLFLLDTRYFSQNHEWLNEIFRQITDPFLHIILFIENDSPIPKHIPDHLITSTFSLPLTENNGSIYQSLLHNSIKKVLEEEESIDLRKRLLKRSHELHEVSKIGKALATERNHDTLLRMILDKAKELAVCDSGSLYLVEADPITKKKRLRFKLSSMSLDT